MRLIAGKYSMQPVCTVTLSDVMSDKPKLHVVGHH